MKNIESEKTLERSLKNSVEVKLKGWCLKLLSAHITGLPDRLCLFPGGRILFVELKTTNRKPRKIQVFMHNKIRGLGFRVEVIDSSEQIERLIREYEI
jgi:hypothetical protein